MTVLDRQERHDLGVWTLQLRVAPCLLMGPGCIGLPCDEVDAHGELGMLSALFFIIGVVALARII